MNHTELLREISQALEAIAAPMRPDGTWNRDREACRELAANALVRIESATDQEAQDIKAQIAELTRQRDELLAAFEHFLDDPLTVADRVLVRESRAVIASVKGAA